MADRHLWNRTLEVKDSGLQDSSAVIGKDTQSISIVTNSDSDSNWSDKIQGMLANILSTLSSI